MASLLDSILRMGEGRILRRLETIAREVNALEPIYQSMSDEELREQTDHFRAKLADGAKLDDLMADAFAAVREAASRTLRQRHFDVQVMGGAALHLGNIAEMKTGEGKTLVATLPSYLNALTGEGVHVVTVNDYLAKYQSDLMSRVYRALGMTTGCVLTGQTPAERREQYAADITYGTNNEFGFDYLRDNMAWTMDELVQRGHHFAILDEVDSILIDEARTPLIISGPADGDSIKWYQEFARIARRLKRDVDYEVDEKKKTVGILEPGIEKVEDALGIDNLYDPVNTPLIGFLNNAIRAKELFRRDVDYVVMSGEVLIIDERTGRMLPGRRYNEGLHQAIEAKEGVEIKAENQTLATITLQNYFRLYSKLSGMTGTAMTEAAEFQSTYKIGVVPIPTHKEMIRIDRPDLVFKTEEAKFDAVVADIVERHAEGQPVLVGTVSVEKSEYLSQKLRRVGIPHEVLNAKEHQREASVVALAGRKGAVTVATNMAGRGTDIMLGGNAEFLATEAMEAAGYSLTEDPAAYEAAWPEILQSAEEQVKAEHDEVKKLGGLYVLGTERHDARRIDNQLRGRSGRQGDPGESRFYLSMQDDLMRRFGSATAEAILTRGNFPDDVPLESKLVTRGIASAQGQVEAANTETRKNVLKYDDVMTEQRSITYAQRRQLLEGADLGPTISAYIDEVVEDFITAATAEGNAEDWDLDTLWRDLKTVIPLSITAQDVVDEAGDIRRVTRDMLVRELQSDAHLAYQGREKELGETVMRLLERRVMLSVVDRKWREHLYEMDYLREGIGLRAFAQRQPLTEYQQEGFRLFQAMREAVREDVVRLLFSLQVQVQQPDEAQTPQQGAPAAADAAEAARAKHPGRVGSGEATQAKQAAKQPELRVEAAPGGVPGLGAQGLGAPRQVPLQYSAPSEAGGEQVQGGGASSAFGGGATRTATAADARTYPGTPRNAMCPCGSGKKYKMCHGKNEE